MNVSKSKVYDLPTRLFHWFYAFLFLMAFVIAKTVDDESITYSYHMLAGILMVFVVLLRVLWGIFGSRYAKFSSFHLKPSELIDYIKSLLSSKTKRYLGHNPASSYSAILMFLFSLGLASTGLLMSKGINKHFFEDVHELLANGFIVVVIAHIIGVVFHQIKHKDAMAFSMFNGAKAAVSGEEEIKSNYAVVAVLFVVLVGGFGLHLKNSFNTESRNLNLFGYSFQLGENESEASESGEGKTNEIRESEVGENERGDND